MPDELWMEVPYVVQEAVIKTIQRKRNQNGKTLSEGALQIAKKRRKGKAKEKRKDIPI